MAFKSAAPLDIVPASPEEILLTLPRRTIPGVLLHQGEIMRSYASQAINQPDVALQLPTGSGKTLVGLMIAEWRRRKFKERVVYLCPTKQFVNQAVEQARTQYGLTVNGFSGSHQNYDPSAKSEYQNADRVAVTNYSSLFNTNPFFADPDVIIIDDAHAAENYIGEMWTVRIQRTRPPHKALFDALTGVLKPHLDAHDFSRLTGRWDANPEDRRWVDKLPTPVLSEISDELTAVIDAHASDLDVKWAWSMIRSHLAACHLYISATELLIRGCSHRRGNTPPFKMRASASSCLQPWALEAILSVSRAGGTLPVCKCPKAGIVRVSEGGSLSFRGARLTKREVLSSGTS